MADLTILPDIIPASIAWLTGLDEVTALIDHRIGTKLPQEAAWPAVRVDLAGGITPIEFRLDQPRLQFGCFAITDAEARTVARVVRAGMVAMAGLRVPGELVVTDVTTTSPQIIQSISRNPALVRVPQVTHATFAAIVTVRPDP